MRICPRCKLPKPDDDFFRRGPNRRPTGECRPCHARVSLARYHARKLARGGEGLTGRSEAERREIADRIEAVSRAKEATEGRTLTPYEVAVAISPTRAPERQCTNCHAKLPQTEEHFYRTHGIRLDGRCRTCRKRQNRQYDLSPQGKAARAAYREKTRERRRQYDRERYRRIKDERGEGSRPGEALEQKLVRLRCQYRWRMRRATDPVRIERYRCQIAEATREIERLRA